MRTAPVLLISSIAHAGLLVLLTPSRSRTRAFVIPALPKPQAPPQPVEVVFLSGDGAPAGGELRSTATSRGFAAAVRRGEANEGRGDIAAGQPSSETSSSESKPGSSVLRMRAGTDLGLDGDVAERIASAPHESAREPFRSGRVEHRRDGTAVVHDTVTKMEIERDGSVHFHDKPDIDIKFHLPVPTWDFDFDKMRREIGEDLTKWYADPYAATRFGRMQDVARHLTAVPGACDSWGDLMCDDPLAPDAEKKVREEKKKVGSFASGNLDITAWLHRKFVGDPYASRKLGLLADTADERAEMGRTYRAHHLGESREIMRQNLMRLWKATTDPRARRTALFELWDECAEGEGPIGEAGERARVVVIDWIREHLPAGSPGAFTPDELAAFAARRTSRQPFAPYE